MDNSIDIISNINHNNNIVDQNNKSSVERKQIVDVSDTTVKQQHASVINKALEIQADLDAVEKARLLIEQGLLDTPENIQAAADRMMEFGI